MKNLEKMFDEALEIVKDNIGEDKLVRKIHRPIGINNRAKRRWGQCRNSGDGKHAVIEISGRILRDEVPDKATMETIIHEILHACEDGHGHKGSWKRYANIINRKTEYNITRATSASTFGLEDEQSELVRKYACECKRCGKVIYKSKISKFIQHPEWYTHRDCGGCFKRIV